MFRTKVYNQYIGKSKINFVGLSSNVDFTINSKSLEYPTIRKFFVIYDTYIDEENILKYFFLPIKYFVNSLILYKLQNIKFYGKTKSKAKGRKIQR